METKKSDGTKKQRKVRTELRDLEAKTRKDKAVTDAAGKVVGGLRPALCGHQPPLR